MVVGVATLALVLALPLLSRRWNKWAVPNPILRASTTKAPLHSAAFSNVVTRLPTSITGYLRPYIRVLASPLILFEY